MFSLRMASGFLVLSAALSIPGCGVPVSQTGDASSCVPGETIACTCDGGAHGASTCSSAGVRGPCVCGATLDGSGMDSSADGVTAMDVSGDVSRCDMDGDGHAAATVECGGDDCDDTDPERHPLALERCSGTLASGASAAAHDEDCNPCTVYASAIDGDGDADHDGFPAAECTNPWLTSAPPAGCPAMVVNVVPPSGSETRGSVRGSDCSDDPGVVMPSGTDGGDDAGDDASSDGNSPDAGHSLTGRDIHPGQTESCNGLDDNCNGSIDEDVGDLFYRDCDGDLFGDVNDTGTRACSSDRLPECMGHAAVRDHTDCDETIAGVHPGALEICNGLDDDCNLAIDDGIPQIGTPCATGLMGPCAAGVYQCHGASSGLQCAPSTMPGTESCNNIDDDCDGVVDDGDPGDHSGCSTGLPGVCGPGTNHCVGGRTQCVQNTGAGSEVVCNGIDDDCNPSTPDAPSDPCYEGPAGTENRGVCHGGTHMCSGTTLICAGQHTPDTEVCDSADNNCDGTRNEGFTCSPGDVTSCSICSYSGSHTCTSSCGWPDCTLPLSGLINISSAGSWSCISGVCGSPSGGSFNFNNTSFFLPAILVSSSWQGLDSGYTGRLSLRVSSGSVSYMIQVLSGSTWNSVYSSPNINAPYGSAIDVSSYVQGSRCFPQRIVFTINGGSSGTVDYFISTPSRTSY